MWYNVRMGILYKITFPNGKAYIGVTTESLARRLRRHIGYARANRQYALSCAIRKYGEGSLRAEVIGEADTWDALLILERDAIRDHKTLAPDGYNMTGGGEGAFRVSPSEEKRRKISAALSGRKLSPEHKLAVSLSQRGKVIPEATRKKMSEAHQGRAPMSDEQKRVRSEALKRYFSSRRSAPATFTTAD